MSPKPGILLLTLLLCIAFPLAAQQSPAVQDTPALEKRNTGPSPQSSADTGPVFHTSVRRVIEDVVVTDSQGNAVPNLTRDDFLLKENGVVQKALSFDVHDGTKPEYTPPKLPPLPPNTYVDVPSAPETGPLYILLYDMVNMELTDQAYSRKPLLAFVDSKPPGTRFAIFLNTDKTSLIQGFTQDKALLQAALTSAGPGPHLPKMFLYGNNYGKGNTSASLTLFEQLAKYLQGVPGRKNLIWISGSFPLNLYPEEGSTIPQEEVKQTIGVMTRAQIALYLIDVTGVSIDGGGAGAVGGIAGNAASGSAVSRSGATGPKGGVSQSALNYINEDSLAEMTGGHAYYSNNHIGEMLTKAASAGASYYTLTYSPTNRDEDGSQRNISIKLDKPGYQLAYRQFYYAVSPKDEKPAKPGSVPAADPTVTILKSGDTLYTSILHGTPMLHDLLFSTHIRTEGKPAYGTPRQISQIINEPAYFRTRSRRKSFQLPPAMKLQKFLIDYRVIDPQLKTSAAQTGRQPMLEFAAAAYDPAGRMVNGVLNDATATAHASPDSKASAFFSVEQEIDLPAEAAFLRLVVRDTLTDRSGTLEIPLPLKAEPAPKQ